MLNNRQDACSTKSEFSCGVGILPTQRRVIENGVRGELKLISSTIFNNRQDACSTKSEFSCGVGILPAQRRVIEKSARCELKLISCTILNKAFMGGQEVHPTRN